MSDAFQPCQQLIDLLADERMPFIYVPRFREYGIRLASPSSAFHVMRFCPFCGQEFPPSLRDDFFDRLDELELELEDAPPEMRTDEWWHGGTTSNGTP